MHIHRRIYWRLKENLRRFKSWLYWVAYKGTGIPKNTEEWVRFSFEPSRLNLLGRYRRERQKERIQKMIEEHAVHVSLYIGSPDLVEVLKQKSWIEAHEEEEELS